jgi:type III pantothenate kinase
LRPFIPLPLSAMNLVLDFGNTRIKAALFKKTELLEKHVFDSPAELLNSKIPAMSIKNCLIGSVTQDHGQVYEEFSTKFNTHLFTTATPIPLKNLYKSALTLGSDRLAASIGSYSFYPHQNVLTIDAGTCIKYNFVNAQNEYLGGAISPGISMRLKAMHQFTSALPQVKEDDKYEKLVGQSTNESMLSGSYIAAACEVDEMINRYSTTYHNLQVMITGGDADYLCRQLKNRFFANQNILLHGLNTILNYTLEK